MQIYKCGECTHSLGALDKLDVNIALDNIYVNIISVIYFRMAWQLYLEEYFSKRLDCHFIDYEGKVKMFLNHN